MEEVLKTEGLLNKTDWQRKTYPLKLNLTDIQRVRLEQIMYEYKKTINKIIQTITKDFFPNHLRRIVDEDIKEGNCVLCQKKKKLSHELKDFEFVKYGELKGKDNYKPLYKKDNEIKVCEMCSCSHYSLRKFILPSKNRVLPKPQWDCTKDSPFSTTNLFDSCIQKAVETIKSQIEIKKNIDWKVNFYSKRITDNQARLTSEMNSLEPNKGEIKKLINFIKKDEKNIEKERRKKAEDIAYKSNTIRLYENAYDIIKEDNDSFIKFKDYIRDKDMILAFYGKEYQKKLADKFLQSKKAETEIVRKGDDFYLQYIYKKEVKVPIPDETFSAVGIDINIINLACLVSMSKDLKKIDVKFYDGRQMRYKRRRFKEMRKIWASKMKYKENGGKGRSQKWFKKRVEAQNEHDYTKYKIHTLTTHIVQYVKDRYDKPVIVLENLKDIRNKQDRELKIAKETLKKAAKNSREYIIAHKRLTMEINSWNFDDFQKFIEYKAKWFGIPVIYVSAKDTSIRCNKCGHTDKDNYESFHEVRFKCKNCCYECNVDFNAATNIARNYYISLQKPVLLTAK